MMRLVLAVEIPDGADLADLGVAIRDSFLRAAEDDRQDGRIRIHGVSEAIGGWEAVEIGDDVEVSQPWSSGLIDRTTAVRLDDGAVEIVVECGANPADPEATPDEGFSDVVIPARDARTLGLALAAWSLR